MVKLLDEDNAKLCSKDSDSRRQGIGLTIGHGIKQYLIGIYDQTQRSR